MKGSYDPYEVVGNFSECEEVGDREAFGCFASEHKSTNGEERCGKDQLASAFLQNMVDNLTHSSPSLNNIQNLTQAELHNISKNQVQNQYTSILEILPHLANLAPQNLSDNVQNIPQNVQNIENIPQDVSQNIPQNVQNNPQNIANNVRQIHTPVNMHHNIPQNIYQNIAQSIPPNYVRSIYQSAPQSMGNIAENMPEHVENMPENFEHMPENIQNTSQNIQNMSQNMFQNIHNVAESPVKSRNDRDLKRTSTISHKRSSVSNLGIGGEFHSQKESIVSSVQKLYPSVEPRDVWTNEGKRTQIVPLDPSLLSVYYEDKSAPSSSQLEGLRKKPIEAVGLVPDWSEYYPHVIRVEEKFEFPKLCQGGWNNCKPSNESVKENNNKSTSLEHNTVQFEGLNYHVANNNTLGNSLLNSQKFDQLGKVDEFDSLNSKNFVSANCGNHENNNSNKYNCFNSNKYNSYQYNPNTNNQNNSLTNEYYDNFHKIDYNTNLTEPGDNGLATDRTTKALDNYITQRGNETISQHKVEPISKINTNLSQKIAAQLQTQNLNINPQYLAQIYAQIPNSLRNPQGLYPTIHPANYHRGSQTSVEDVQVYGISSRRHQPQDVEEAGGEVGNVRSSVGGVLPGIATGGVFPQGVYLDGLGCGDGRAARKISGKSEEKTDENDEKTNENDEKTDENDEETEEKIDEKAEESREKIDEKAEESREKIDVNNEDNGKNTEENKDENLTENREHNDENLNENRENENQKLGKNPANKDGPKNHTVIYSDNVYAQTPELFQNNLLNNMLGPNFAAQNFTASNLTTQKFAAPNFVAPNLACEAQFSGGAFWPQTSEGKNGDKMCTESEEQTWRHGEKPGVGCYGREKVSEIGWRVSSKSDEISENSSKVVLDSISDKVASETMRRQVDSVTFGAKKRKDEMYHKMGDMSSKKKNLYPSYPRQFSENFGSKNWEESRSRGQMIGMAIPPQVQLLTNNNSKNSDQIIIPKLIVNRTGPRIMCHVAYAPSRPTQFDSWFTPHRIAPTFFA